ncbi:uncharacterized protein [Watersipora subatra]|uniref:uncharacterized protein n=1 Tax=Watersipora subatra TaxID=2589382 RepID=UPI00355B080D
MPKLSETLCSIRFCRRKNLNQRPVMPVFKQLLPAELKDKVRGTKEGTSGDCMGPMQVLMSCWNKYDFESTSCKQEVLNFQKCVERVHVEAKKKKDLDAKGLIVAEDTGLTRKQVNTLLRNNIQRRPKDKFGEYYKNRLHFD